jgi:hypothetical protein
MFARKQFNIEHCNDVRLRAVGEPRMSPKIWSAVSGTLTVERGPRGVNREEPWLFRATVRLDNVIFKGPRGGTLHAASISLEGYVGATRSNNHDDNRLAGGRRK